MVYFGQYCPCQETRPALTEEDFQGGTRKMEMDEFRKQCNKDKGFTVVRMWKCGWWKL